MNKRTLLLVIFVFATLLSDAQIKNEFIKKNSLVVYPGIVIEKNTDNEYRYGLKMELAYMPLNRLEIRPGMSFAFGYRDYFATSVAGRFYILKSKFTVFPEICYSYAFNTKFSNYYSGIGVGYYGIFKRIGLDIMANYYPITKVWMPSLKLKILLNKLDE